MTAAGAGNGRTRLLAVGSLAAALFLVFAAVASVANADALKTIRTLLEVRHEVRVSIGTWKRYGHLAADERKTRLEESEKLAERIHNAYKQGLLTPQRYMELLELRHQLNEIAEKGFTERRRLNQRMLNRAKQSQFLSRLPVIKLFKKKQVYTYKIAEQAIKDSNSVRLLSSRSQTLRQSIEKFTEVSEKKPVLCSKSTKDSLATLIDNYNKKWAERWCSPHIWSGCGEPALIEANGLRYVLAGAKSKNQCDWVRRMASCKDGCMMSYIGDAGAAKRAECLRNCNSSLPYPNE